MAPQIAVAIREATLADVPAMAEVTAAGFLEDDVFGKFIHPHRKQFPEDWNRFWQKEIRIHLMRATSRSYVCIESASGRVAAICLMNRLGKDASQSVDTETLESKIQKAGAVLLNPWDEEGWTDRSADPVAQEKFDKNWGEISHHFSGNRRQCWLIDFFCVYPDFQHKGIGSLLLQQAVELGMNEDPKVPVAVISSTIGDPFYTKFGFIQVGRANVGDLSHVEGGSIKFYERHLNQN